METIKKHNKDNKTLLTNNNGTVKLFKLTEAVNNHLIKHYPKPEGRIIISKKLYHKDTINSIKIQTLPISQEQTIKKVEKEENQKESNKHLILNSKSKTSEFKFSASFKIAKKVPTVQYGSVDVEEYRTARADTLEELNENYQAMKEEAFKELKISEEKLREK